MHMCVYAYIEDVFPLPRNARFLAKWVSKASSMAEVSVPGSACLLGSISGVLASKSRFIMGAQEPIQAALEESGLKTLNSSTLADFSLPI